MLYAITKGADPHTLYSVFVIHFEKVLPGIDKVAIVYLS